MSDFPFAQQAMQIASAPIKKPGEIGASGTEIPIGSDTLPLSSTTAAGEFSTPLSSSGVGKGAMEEEENIPEAYLSHNQALPRNQLKEAADPFLIWLVRYPVERNHPRQTTGSLPLWKSGDAVTVQSNEKVASCFKKLITEGFLSAPVLDERRHWLGFIDLLDLTVHTLRSFRKWQPSMSMAVDTSRSEGFWSAYMQQEEWYSATVGQVMESFAAESHIQPFIPVYKGFSLFHVVELMARVGVHRVPILDPHDNKVTGIITQSMVISLIDQHMGRLGEINSIPISWLMAGLRSNVVTVQENDTASTAFSKCCDEKIYGCAVVDDKGNLTDAISVRDLRGIGVDAGKFQRLDLTVKEYKALLRQEFPQQTPPTPISVSKKDTFQTVITRMSDGNIHRVFVVEKNAIGSEVPVAVISQRDIFRLLLWMLGLQPSPTDVIIP